MPNPLDPIITWYTTLKDSVRVTRRVIEKTVPGVITNRHVFHGRGATDNEAALDKALKELDHLVILALTAVFERTLRDHVRALPVLAPSSGNPHHNAVRNEILKDVEFWNISSRVIDVFTTVDAVLRGDVKQIIDYRNWVAHGKTNSQPRPVNTTPVKAHRRLTDFLLQAGIIVP